LTDYPPCDVAYHVDCLDREGLLLADAARRAGLDAPVPACSGWQVRDLLAHIGYVHRWAAGYVAGQRMEPESTPAETELLRQAPSGPELLGWYRDGHAELVRTLRKAAPDTQCWTFLPAPSPLAFWARRQAHETAIHRADAEQAAGAAAGDGAAGRRTRLSGYPAGFAADGLDELLRGFLARNLSRRGWQGRPGRLAVHADDGPAGQAAWLVDTGPGATVSRGAGPADCAVTGPASSLYLALWNRQPITGLEIQGDAALLADFGTGLQVTWR
jgi:uncharacterized protein (TIGR03083 family)